ncbi:MAG: hypothetical protein JWM47_2794 [Acidimicrobiales bacterium]|nr:hypothetical protein [Acidimicrobiales bacterium]
MTDHVRTQLRPRRRAGRAGLCVLGLVVALAACTDDEPAASSRRAPTAVTFDSSDPASGTTAPTTPAGIGVGEGPAVGGRTPLRGFSEVAATVTAGDGTTCEVCLLAATTSAQRSRGLMEVTDADLGGYDGMLFQFPEPVDGAFWMRNTPLPLSIAYFDADRVLVSTTDMEPCVDSADCPHYPPDGPFQFALEVPKGRLDDLAVTGRATFAITGTPCPAVPLG